MKQHRLHATPAVRARSARQKGFLSSRQALVLLALIFLAPTFVAWVVHHTGDDGWQPSGTTNRGMLVHPARPLELPADMVIGGRPLTEYLQGKWTLVHVGAAACGDVCRENLYKIRQVRIAQNENMRRVQRLFLVTSGDFNKEVADFLAEQHPQLDTLAITPEQLGSLAKFFSIDDTPVQDAGRVYIVDPLGNLMMYYPSDADASGMLKDLRKLLKYSRIG